MRKEMFPESIRTEMEPAEHESKPAASVSAAAQGRIQVRKMSAFTSPVTGAGYGVYTDQACTKAVDALWIGKVDKNSDVSIDLSLGTYYVKELDSGVPNGYEKDEKIYTVKLTENEQMVTVYSYEPSKEPHGYIRVVKKSLFDLPVTGAGYGIYEDEACTKAFQSLWIGKEDANSALSADLPLNKTFYVKEFSAPKGYEKDKTVYTVSITKDKEVVTVTSTEPIAEPYGTIKVIKESSSSSPVTGAGYGIYKDAAYTKAVDSLWIGKVDANSDISVNLPPDTYFVKEFSAPKGYALDPTVYRVDITGHGQQKIVTSKEPALYYPDGIPFDEAGVGSTFPSCICDDYNVLGWSSTKHGIFTSEDIKPGGKSIVDAVGDYFMEGEDIPSGDEKYYMVAYRERKDAYSKEISKPTNNTVVYFVGDSRTVYIYELLVNGKALSADNSSLKNKPLDGRIEFVAKRGQGLEWFMGGGLNDLKTKLAANKGKNNVIIFNLGVNDAAAPDIKNTYENIFKVVETELKNKDSGCKLYYADVYPISYATLVAHDEISYINMKQIKDVNETIDKICQNGEFSKIDLYNHLKKYGWFYDINKCQKGPNIGTDMYDGIHPSPTTAMNVYEFCLEKAGCKSNEKVMVSLIKN